MKPKGLSSLEINREVRRILVAHWIDLGRVSIHSVKVAAYIRGTLQKLPGADSSVNAACIEAIHDKIRRIPGVRHIHMQLDNWVKGTAGGGWESIGAGRDA